MKYILITICLYFLSIACLLNCYQEAGTLPEKEVSFEPETYMVSASVYHACPKQTNSEPYITAFGYRIDKQSQYKHRYVAVSRDLLDIFSKGDSVYISDCGIYSGLYVIADKMNKRWQNKIDILIDKDMPQGLWHDVKIKKIK